jgi:hypothetical protein
MAIGSYLNQGLKHALGSARGSHICDIGLGCEPFAERANLELGLLTLPLAAVTGT